MMEQTLEQDKESDGSESGLAVDATGDDEDAMSTGDNEQSNIDLSAVKRQASSSPTMRLSQARHSFSNIRAS